MDSFYENNSPRDDMENCLSAQFNSASVGYEDGFAPEHVERQLRPSGNEDKRDTSDQESSTLYPVSFRVTADEKAHLKQAAGKASVSHYVRQRLLGDLAEIRPKHYERKQKEPSVDAVEIARLLGMFGQSELVTSILALSLSAAQGTLEMPDDMFDKVDAACGDIQTIKLMLIMALAVEPPLWGYDD